MKIYVKTSNQSLENIKLELQQVTDELNNAIEDRKQLCESFRYGSKQQNLLPMNSYNELTTKIINLNVKKNQLKQALQMQSAKGV